MGESEFLRRRIETLLAGRRAYLFLALTGFLGAFSLSVVQPVLPLYVESFGVSYEKVGLLFSAYSFTWAGLQLYTGYLADRLGQRRMALVGFALYATFALLNYTSRSFAQLLLFRVLQGVGLGLLGPAVLGLAAGFEEKGRSFAIYRAAHGAGNILGPIAGGLFGGYSLRPPFLLSGLSAFLAGGAVLAIQEARAAQPEARFFRAVSSLLRSKPFLLICVAGFLAELGYASFGIAIPLAGKGLGLSPSQIGVVLSSYALSFTLFQVPVGAYADRSGRRRLLVGTSFLSALLFLGLYAARGFLTLASLMALLGVALGAIFVQSTALVAEVAAEGTRAMCLAFFDALIDLSFIVMPLIVGFAAGLGESMPFLVCAIFLAGAGVLFQRYRSPLPAREGQGEGQARQQQDGPKSAGRCNV
jgi:DHA1 family multidrug resistance protein-like MFS transporter